MYNKKNQNGEIYSLLSSSVMYKNQERPLLGMQNLHNICLTRPLGGG